MTLWIVTTGNSDVQMKKCTNWIDLYEEAEEFFEDNHPDLCEKGLVQDEATKLYPVPARVLGQVYCAALDEDEAYYDDLAFPLLDTFGKIFGEGEIQKPTQVLILLTNQSQSFLTEKKQLETCPYWQDTCTLQPILDRYFQEKFDIAPTFATIAPKKDLNNPVPAGIDNWDAMLKTVGETLEMKLGELDIDREKDIVYVSHQAGTPAISSAVQFLSISQFKQVQFLVSNPFYDDESETMQGQAQLIRSSRYSRGIKFADIKKLLNSRWDFSGAKEILQEFEEQSDDSSTEKEQIYRIVNALQIGEDCLNLDLKGAKFRLNSQLPNATLEEVKEDDRLLNIYTQCRMYWQLDRTANFLSLVSSFYEGVLERIFEDYEGEKQKFTLNYSPDNLQCYEQIKNIPGCKKISKNLKNKRKPKKFSDFQNRYDKRKWISLLISSRNNENEKKAWNNLLSTLYFFDFWCSYRNKLIHGAKGISKERLQEVWEQRDLSKDNDKNACSPDKILKNMEAILQNDLKLLKREEFQKFVGEDADSYIYSAVRNYAIEQLEKFENSSN